MVKIEELLKEETTKVRMGQVFCSFDYPCGGPKCSVMRSRILSAGCGIHVPRLLRSAAANDNVSA